MAAIQRINQIDRKKDLTQYILRQAFYFLDLLLKQISPSFNLKIKPLTKYSRNVIIYSNKRLFD